MNNRGVALILTLFVLVALVLLAAGLGVMARTEVQISKNYGDSVRCRWAARSGVSGAMGMLSSLTEDGVTYLGEEPYYLSSGEMGADLGDCEFVFVIVDETSKLNVNTAPVESLALLFEDDETADCIVDWRDEDSTPGMEGAESDYYLTLDPPYNCKNSDLETVGELRLVKGIDEYTLSSLSSDGLALGDMVTVYKHDETQTASDLVDIQSAGRDDLLSGLGSVLSEQDVDAIVSYRSQSRFRYPSDIVRVPGLDRSKIMQIYDKLTVSGAESISGKVNVNTAGLRVLSVLPEMDESAAQEVLDYRGESEGFDSVGALLAVKDLSDDAFAGAAPYLTVRSSVFRIISTGSLGDGASVTIECVVELGGSGEPQIRYWRG